VCAHVYKYGVYICGKAAAILYIANVVVGGFVFNFMPGLIV